MRHCEHFRVDWRGILIEIRYCPNWIDMSEAYGYQLAHLEVESIEPARAVLPIEQREAVAMERKLAALEREDRALSLENFGTDHSQRHDETPQRRIFERGNLQVEFNESGEFAEGKEQAQKEDEAEERALRQTSEIERPHKHSHRPSHRRYRRDED